MAKDNDKGRNQHQQDHAHHLPNLTQYYGKKMRSITPGEFNFKIVLIRPEKSGKSRTLTLDPAITSLSWADEGTVLTGNLSINRSQPNKPDSVPIQNGHVIRLAVSTRLNHNHWYRLWDMRVSGEPAPDLLSGAVNVPLSDDLEALQQDEEQWEFAKNDNQYKQGWKAHEITKRVCQKCRVRPGKIAKGHDYLDKIKLTGSGLEVIQEAYKQEADNTSQQYVISFKRGKLNVTAIHREKTAYVIRGMETSATLAATPKNQRPHTVIKATGRINDEKKTLTIARKEPMKRFGRVVLEKDYGKLDSMGALRDKARAELRKELKVSRQAQMTIPGIPFLRRGSTVRWINSEPGWHGESHSSHDLEYAFVKAATHTLDPSGYFTDVTLSQHDPYLADQRRKDREKRDAKKKAKNQ